MPIIINPGSGAIQTGSKWTNTHEVAKQNAYSWFYKPMLEQGFTDIKVEDTGKEQDGRWLFIFKHEVTGVSVELEIHGIDNLKNYEDEFIFTPRVYWNGSSSSNPELRDFKADGFEPVMSYRPTPSSNKKEKEAE